MGNELRQQYQEGYTAFLNGKSRDTNPWLHEQAKAFWNEGYDAAKVAHEAKTTTTIAPVVTTTTTPTPPVVKE